MDKLSDIEIRVCANGYAVTVMTSPNEYKTFRNIRTFNYKHELYAWLDQYLAEPKEEPTRRE